MSMASGLPNNLDKAPYEETHDVAVKYDLGGAEGAGFDVSNADRSYTRNDQMDMQRMGKNQELMVSASSWS
jgi:hypothetical protein